MYSQTQSASYRLTLCIINWIYTIYIYMPTIHILKAAATQALCKHRSCSNTHTHTSGYIPRAIELDYCNNNIKVATLRKPRMLERTYTNNTLRATRQATCAIARRSSANACYDMGSSHTISRVVDWSWFHVGHTHNRILMDGWCGCLSLIMYCNSLLIPDDEQNPLNG